MRPQPSRYIDLPHRDAMMLHACRRLYQRHGFAITAGEYNSIVFAIVAGNSPVLADGRAGNTIHLLNIRGRSVYAIFNTEHQAIATFLPKGVPTEVQRTYKVRA